MRRKEDLQMNPMKLMQVKAVWDKFSANHPKFPKFLRAVGNGTIQTGTVIEVSVTTAEGKNYSTNLKIQEEDMELFRELKEMMS